MAASHVDAMPFRAMQLGNCCDGTHTDPDSLKIRQRHDPREPPVILLGNKRHGRAKIDWSALPGRQVTPRAARKFPAQIVMTLKQLPRSHVTAMDFQVDRRSAKQTPGFAGGSPHELTPRHINDPIRFQPVGHIVMASYCDESTRNAAAADSLGNCRRTNFRHRAINNTREFIDHYQCRMLNSLIRHSTFVIRHSHHAHQRYVPESEMPDALQRRR
jgi:hypothetical protein